MTWFWLFTISWAALSVAAWLIVFDFYMPSNDTIAIVAFGGAALSCALAATKEK